MKKAQPFEKEVFWQTQQLVQRPWGNKDLTVFKAVNVHAGLKDRRRRLERKEGEGVARGEITQAWKGMKPSTHFSLGAK